MINTDDKRNCSGCGVCEIVCPKQCIVFKTDILGSRYPEINTRDCIDCKACERVCPFQPDDETRKGESAYAAFSIDKTKRFRGSSGGIFETIAAWILEQNGVVYACKFDDNLKLRMFEATSINDVINLTKSKYLQCDSVELFPRIKSNVAQNKKVLVCSTPCQIKALKNYLGNLSESKNLLLIDFFCHGVPSQSFFDKCLKYVENKKGIKILAYEFRSKKKNGSTPHYFTVKYLKHGHVVSKTCLYYKDPFYLGFQKYLTLRDSCYQCPFGCGNHPGDLTIGDFHEVDKYIKGINRFDGVSTVILNNEKGKFVWNSVKDSLVSYELDICRLIIDHQIYAGGTKEPANRTAFLKDLENLPFNEVIEKWLSSKSEWKKGLYYHLPSFVRKRIKAVLRVS